MQTVELFKSDREFRIWSVDSIELPTTMTGVMLLVESNATGPYELALDNVRPGDNAGPYSPGRRFVLRGAGYEGSVVAGAAAVHEDHGEWHEPAYWDDPRHIRGGA